MIRRRGSGFTCGMLIVVLVIIFGSSLHAETITPKSLAIRKQAVSPKALSVRKRAITSTATRKQPTIAAVTPAKSKNSNFGKDSKQLQGIATDLRSAGEAMRLHAKTMMPKRLDKAERARFTAKCRELEATADAALKLAVRIKKRERNARLSRQKRVDMESLWAEADPLVLRINRRNKRPLTRKTTNRAELNKAKNRVESQRESVRNKRQMANTAFENFDQKANQLYNLLASVMKAMNEMRMGTVRNML